MARSSKSKAASRRNGAAGADAGYRGGRPLAGSPENVRRRSAARLMRDEAEAALAQANARARLGELCVRSEAMAEVQRITRIVRAELDRVTTYLDPGLTPEVRAASEAALRTATAKLRQRLADAVAGPAQSTKEHP